MALLVMQVIHDARWIQGFVGRLQVVGGALLARYEILALLIVCVVSVAQARDAKIYFFCL